MVDGTEYELDCLIYASGFEVGTDFTRRWGFDVTGRDGETLSEHWADGMTSLHGIHVHGFPNMYIVSPTQGANLISNVPHNLTEAGADDRRRRRSRRARQVRSGSKSPKTTSGAGSSVLEAGGSTFGGDPTCTPGYYNNEGHGIADSARRNTLGYPEGPVAYFEHIERLAHVG